MVQTAARATGPVPFRIPVPFLASAGRPLPGHDLSIPPVS